MIGRQKFSVEIRSNSTVVITEEVKNPPRGTYRATVLGNLTKKQALQLGLLLIKAAQQ